MEIRPKTRRHISALCLIFLSVSAFRAAVAADGVTPSHVYQQTQRIIAEIHLLRDAEAVETTAREPGVASGKLPLHVYGKSLELLEKVSRAQRRLGIPEARVGRMPVADVEPVQVYESTEIILSELRRIKARLRVDRRIEEAPFVAGKVPSDVYEQMWRASYLMDGLVEEINPGFVYRNTEYIIEDVQLVFSHLGISQTDSQPPKLAGMKPKNANISGYKNLHRMAMLQRKLGMKPLRVPSFPYGDITPSDVYDSTNMLLAELVRIKVFLGIHKQHSVLPIQQGITPSDVVMNMQFVAGGLDAMIALL